MRVVSSVNFLELQGLISGDTAVCTQVRKAVKKYAAWWSGTGDMFSTHRWNLIQQARGRVRLTLLKAAVKEKQEA